MELEQSVYEKLAQLIYEGNSESGIVEYDGEQYYYEADRDNRVEVTYLEIVTGEDTAEVVDEYPINTILTGLWIDNDMTEEEREGYFGDED